MPFVSSWGDEMMLSASSIMKHPLNRNQLAGLGLDE